MSWVKQRSRRYYHRKIWKDGRSVSVYIGAGRAAEAAAAEDAEAAAERRLLMARHAEQYALADAVEAAAAPLAGLVLTLTAAGLLATGHHYDDHGEWKRLRRKKA